MLQTIFRHCWPRPSSQSYECQGVLMDDSHQTALNVIRRTSLTFTGITVCCRESHLLHFWARHFCELADLSLADGSAAACKYSVIVWCVRTLSSCPVVLLLASLPPRKSGLILSVQSNQFVQSKMQFVQSKMRNCAVQKHKVEDIIVHFSKSILITSLRSSI